MIKPPYDLRDYLFDELDLEQRTEVEAYLASSSEARQELERLQITHRSLLSLPEEEIPRRIAFVSDKIFEPKGVGQFWQKLWTPAEHFGFGAAVALLVLFAGIWTVQPSLRVDQEGWQLAFGTVSDLQVTEAHKTESTAVANLMPDQMRAMAVTLIDENNKKLRDEISQLVASTVSRESENSERLWRAAVEQLRRESEQGWRILRTDFEDLAYTTSAEAKPMTFER